MDKVVHFEIPADDLARADKFYKDVFGWQIEAMTMPGGMEYHMATTKGKKDLGAINGGLMKRSPMVAATTVAMNVASIDETMKKIQAAGGSMVMPKMPVADMGFYAYAKDSEGNVIGVWEDAKKYNAQG